MQPVGEPTAPRWLVGDWTRSLRDPVDLSVPRPFDFAFTLGMSLGGTIGDLTDDALGAVRGGLLLLVWDLYGWGTRRRIPVGHGEREA